MLFKKIIFTLVLTICIENVCFAQFIAWTDNIPSSLKPFQDNPQSLANITQDNIFIYTQSAQKTFLPTLKNNPNPTVRFTTAAIVVPVNAQEVAKVLTDYSHYIGLFPTVKSAKIQGRIGNISQVKYKISVPTPIPILNFNEDVTIQHQIGQNSIASLIIDAPIPYAAGKFEWFNLGEKKTLITLTQWGDLNQPQGFVFSKMLNAIPDAKLGIPSATNAFLLEALKRHFTSNKTVNLSAGQLPNPILNEAQIEKITQLSQASGKAVSFVLPPTTVPYTHGREMMRFTTTYRFYPTSPDHLQKWLKPDSYQAVFPKQIKKTMISALNAQGQDATFKVNVSLGVISIPFDFKMHFTYPNTFENNFFANGGDLRYLKGKTQIFGASSGTLLKMTTSVKIDDRAPFLLRAMRSLPYHEMLPAVAANIIFMEKIGNLK